MKRPSPLGGEHDSNIVAVEGHELTSDVHASRTASVDRLVRPVSLLARNESHMPTGGKHLDGASVVRVPRVGLQLENRRDDLGSSVNLDHRIRAHRFHDVPLSKRGSGNRNTAWRKDVWRASFGEQSHRRHRSALLAAIATMVAGSIGYAATGREGFALLAVLALGASLWALDRLEATR